MSYDEKTGKMDWRDEYAWMAISIISGLALSFLYLYFNRFPNASRVVLVSICCVGFYALSILIRAQNHRGMTLTGKTGFNEKSLKFIFPIFGFGIGLAFFFL